MLRSVALGLASAALVVTPAWSAGNAKVEARNRQTMHDYARCVVRKERMKAAEAILSNSNNATILRQYPGLINGECLGQVAGDVEMKFSGDLYRYALADALVNEALVTRAHTSFADRLALAHLPPPDRAEVDAEIAKTKSRRKRDAIEEEYKKQLGVAWLSRYGECIVRLEPVKARLWLLTPPGLPEEVSRINDLRTAFASCLQDGTMTFNRVVMRGTVAINYYRLAMATPVAGKLN